MAYTIKINKVDPALCEQVGNNLAKKLREDGRFKAEIVLGGFEYRGAFAGSRKSGYKLVLKKIRLTSKQPYCGQHPGECVVNPFIGPTKKKNMTLLEWDDWVEFNNLVNEVLNDIDADVWSNPRDVKGKMWIRKGLRARVKYDYEDDYNNDHSRLTGVPLRVWNQGTEDQFAA